MIKESKNKTGSIVDLKRPTLNLNKSLDKLNKEYLSKSIEIVVHASSDSDLS